MHTDAATKNASPGRPIDDELTAAILDETWAIMAESGYAAVDIQAIARRLGCAKTSIYRRWANRAEMVAAAFMRTSEIGDDPATGDVVEDLIEFELVNTRNQQGRMSHVILEIRDDTVMKTLWERFYGPRQELALMLIDRAVERGQLPIDTDALAILDLLSGFTLFRNAARQQTTTRDQLGRIVSAIIASPPRIAPTPADEASARD